MTHGGKNTLPIYLLHRYFAFAFQKYFPFTDAKVILAVAIVASLIIFCILKTETVSRAFSSILVQGAAFLTPGAKAKSVLVKSLYGVLILAMVVLPFAKAVIHEQKMEALARQGDPLYRTMSVEKQEQYQNAYRILFAGDLILLEDQVKNGFDGEKYDYSMMFDYNRKYISDADLAIGVFEGPMGGEENGYSTGNYDDGKELYLSFPDAFGKAVKEAGFDLVTTGNNHVLDKGEAGSRRTLDVLDHIGLDHTGSYRSAEEKQEQHIKIIDKNGIKIAVLAYTYGANYHTDEQMIDGDDSYVTSMLVDPKSKYFDKVKAQVEADFAEARAYQPDLIVVLPHMGEQFKDEPNDYQKTWCKVFYDNGADIVFGDHTHSVQPIGMEERNGKMTFTAYCPGNYANIYREHNGDCMALEEVYIDRDTKNIIGGSVIPMWTASALNGNYRPLPIYSILTDDELRKTITTQGMERVREVAAHISETMLGIELPLDAMRERLFFDEHGFMREPVPALPLTEEMQQSDFFQDLTSANGVCFVGDSVTEGTKNGGYGWYEPLLPYVHNPSSFAKGSKTSKWLLEHADDIASTNAELYVIAIGTNDIRYRNPKECAMTSEEYIETLDKLCKKVRSKNPNAKFAFIAPWTSTDGDKNSKLKYADKMAMNMEYSDALRIYCKEENNLYVDPNGYLNDVLDKYPDSRYLNDFIHPNSTVGIALYSKAVLLSAE